ncbi:hypothetical protein [Bailinhaonella thermotolerans]|uniref:Uncharacterized protein n=1 Tax=Bailinhaonella thermotolerans TaxID=1070861 RepID=A0A3A4ARU7_9ACTN|nr:hypothetical protein [Bailinhaonella thermotolerans]RJL24028.1 hypothetical protein D5H75_31880 [Bailinhaonella thermotolerans]
MASSSKASLASPPDGPAEAGPVDLVAEASRLARLAGRDLGPAVTTVAGVSRRAATAALGTDTVRDDRPVTVVPVRGRFGSPGGGLVVPHAPGRPAPSGSVLTLVMDARTGDPLDVYLTDRPPALTGLGQAESPALS